MLHCDHHLYWARRQNQVLAPATGDGRGHNKPSGCLYYSCLRVLEVSMISCVPMMLQCPRLARLLSAGESGTAWGGPGLAQREMVPSECPCPAAAGLLMVGTRLPVVLPRLRRSSDHWTVLVKQQGQSQEVRWEGTALHLASKVLCGFSEPWCKRRTCWRGQPVDPHLPSCSLETT